MAAGPRASARARGNSRPRSAMEREDARNRRAGEWWGSASAAAAAGRLSKRSAGSRPRGGAGSRRRAGFGLPTPPPPCRPSSPPGAGLFATSPFPLFPGVPQRVPRHPGLYRTSLLHSLLEVYKVLSSKMPHRSQATPISTIVSPSRLLLHSTSTPILPQAC